MARQSNTGNFGTKNNVPKNDQINQQGTTAQPGVPGSATPSSTGTGVGGTGSENNRNSAGTSTEQSR